MEVQPYSAIIHRANEFTIRWPRMKPGTAGQPYETDGRTIHSLDVSGNFGNRVEIMLMGSDNGTDWSPLADDTGKLIEIHVPGSQYVGTTPAFVRPVMSPSDDPANTSVQIDLNFHAPKRAVD